MLAVINSLLLHIEIKGVLLIAFVWYNLGKLNLLELVFHVITFLLGTEDQMSGNLEEK